MSLTDKAKEILTVGMADETYANEIADAIDASTTTNATNIAATALNTTHRTSVGTNHSDVGLNNAHRTSDGTDHSDVGLNNAHRIADGKGHSDVVLMNAHIIANGSAHANVASNTAARNTNWKIANIMLATATDNTDAATLGLAVGDMVIEYAQDGNAATACGIAAYVDEFLGDNAEITQVIADTTLNSTDGDYFDITAKSGNLYRVYLDTTGGNVVIPADGGRTLVRVDLSAGTGTAADNADLVAAALAALDGGAEFTAPATGTGTITATDQNTGIVVDAVDPGMANLWAISTTQQGTAGPNAIGNVLIHYKPIV